MYKNKKEAIDAINEAKAFIQEEEEKERKVFTKNYRGFYLSHDSNSFLKFLEFHGERHYLMLCMNIQNKTIHNNLIVMSITDLMSKFKKIEDLDIIENYKQKIQNNLDNYFIK